MLKKNYDYIFYVLIIINIFFWDTYSGIFQQDILFIFLPLIYFFLNYKVIINQSDNSNFFFLILEQLKKDKKILLTLTAIFAFLVLHKIIVSIYFSYSIDKISLIKILFMMLMIYSVYFNFDLIKKNFHKIIIYSLFSVSFVFIVELILNLNSGVYTILYALKNNCYDGFFRKNSIIFMEESHFGMVIPALIVSYIVIITKKKKNFLYFLPLIFLIYSTLLTALSITFIISIITGCIMLLFYKNIKTKIISIIIIIAFLAIPSNMPRCTTKFLNISNDLFDKISINILDKIPSIQINKLKNKIDLVMKKKYIESKNVELNSFQIPKFYEDKSLVINNNIALENQNIYGASLSQAVYVNSFKILLVSIKDNFFGYGIGNYSQVFLKNVENTSKNLTKDKDVNEIVPILNINDASNNFAKIIVEFGIFSLVIFFSILFFVLSNKIKFEIKVFVTILIVTQIFLRGAGYFNGGFILSLSIIFISLFSIKSHEKKRL